MMFSNEDADAYVDKNRDHINRLRKIITNIATVNNIIAFAERLEALKELKHESLTVEIQIEAEAFFTALVMAYGRLFAESKGVQRFNKKLIPKELHSAHDEIIALRNERFAHHGEHESTAAELELFVSESEVSAKIHWRAVMYQGVPPLWQELFAWIERFLHQSFEKQLEFISQTSGKRWRRFDPVLSLEGVKVYQANDLILQALKIS